ncbi:hypothetical protein LFREDSHE_25930 [Shewanella baltica]
MSELKSLEREFAYTTAHFNTARTTLYRFSGIKLADSKDAMVYSRLVRRIRTLKLSGFSAYFDYLLAQESEHQEFINALTTNQTAFLGSHIISRYSGSTYWNILIRKEFGAQPVVQVKSLIR